MPKLLVQKRPPVVWTYPSFTSFPGILPARNLTRVSLQVRLRKPHLTGWEKMGRIGGVVGVANAPA